MFCAIIKKPVACVNFSDREFSGCVYVGEHYFEFAEDPAVRVKYPWSKPDNIAPIVVFSGTMIGVPAWMWRQLIRKGVIVRVPQFVELKGKCSLCKTELGFMNWCYGCRTKS